jgi:hypothetical protein
MELQTIVSRVAECLEYIDDQPSTVGVNRRTGREYQPGVQALTETVVVPKIDHAWECCHPGERAFHAFEEPYPDLPRHTSLDLTFCSRDSDGIMSCNQDEPEWGIEIKRLQFVGDNGKKGDYETAKVLSPFLKDRGMLHDALRLKQYGWSKRIAIIGYGFNYDLDSIAHAAKIHKTPRALETIGNIRNLLNNSGPLHLRTLVEFADAILGLRGLKKGARAEVEFEAWQHPAGGRGVVFGWEIRRPNTEADFDPRHPW